MHSASVTEGYLSWYRKLSSVLVAVLQAACASRFSEITLSQEYDEFECPC